MVAIVETEQVDPPLTRDREDPQWIEQKKREYSERGRREYGDASLGTEADPSGGRGESAQG
jgi:hypothetical protein